MRTIDPMAHYFRVYELVSVFAIGFAVGLAVKFFDPQGIQDLEKLFSNITTGRLPPHETIYLFVVFSLIWYGLLWIVNGYHEVGQLAGWIKTADYQPESPILVCAALLGIGIFFGLLVAYATKFPVFMGLFTLYVICDIYLWRRRRVEMAKITSTMLEAIKKDQQSAKWIARRQKSRPYMSRPLTFFKNTTLREITT